MRREFTIRVRLMTIVFLLAVILLITQLYLVQIVNGKEHKERAEAQYITSAVSTEERNDIFFPNIRERHGLITHGLVDHHVQFVIDLARRNRGAIKRDFALQ